jgi:hypothetical protein
MKALFRQKIGDPIGLHVHAIDFPIGRRDDVLRKMVADESVDAEDEDFFH